MPSGWPWPLRWGPSGSCASAGLWPRAGRPGSAPDWARPSADAVYGLIAAFGLTGLAGLAAGPTPWLKTAGGLFLIGLGLAAILKKTPDRVAEATSGRGLAWAWASTFALTLTNPMTIISFAAVFAGLGLAEQAGSPAAAWMLVAGVFLGSAGWWLVLSGGVGLLRGRLSDRLMLWVNRLAGIFILAFGCWALVESWLK